ncbi:MAG TPA: BACON domain-containing carbohydrate-binding protein [Pyrinomonadaceae bacterium]
MSVVLFAVTLLSIFLGNDLATQKAQEQPRKTALKKYEKSDEITGIIRDTTKNFAVVRINSETDRENAENFGTVVEDYGSFVLVAKDKSQKISSSDSDAQTLETTINLPNGKFEPVINQSEQNFGLDFQKSESIDKNYYLVQFGGIVKDEWLESLREAGIEIVQYVPHQAFIVYGDGSALGKISHHSRVRWIGNYKSEQKISPQLNDFAKRSENETALYDVAVFSRADLAEVSNKFAETIDGKIIDQIKLPKNFFNILRVEIPSEELSKIAEMPDVFRIDPYTKPVLEDERAAHIVAGNFFSATSISMPGYDPLTQFGVDGRNVTVAVVDDGISIPNGGSGFYITSENTVDGPLRGASSGASGGHGHLNASIIAGGNPFGALDPLGYNYGIGIAPKANIVNIPKEKAGYLGNIAQAMDDAVSTAGPNTIKSNIANNSWGNGTNGNTYDAYTAMFDGFVQDASQASSFDPITLVFSAGNLGPNALSLTRPKVAKNVITVGGSESVRPEISATEANNLDDLYSNSSRGPAADGRIKPDVVAPGTVITGSRAGNDANLSGATIDSAHRYSTGTSHSAAQVAGAAALFTNFWKNTRAGINPSPALIKAALINSAQEMNGSGAGSAIPNGNEGWGRINMKYMLNTGVLNYGMRYSDQETTFSNPGETARFEGTVGDPSKPVRVSLVWTDPPGASDPALVNNLDLTVTVGNSVYKGNVFSGGKSVTGGSYDTLNNVENVFLPAGIPAGTNFTIQVSAASLNGDGRPGNGDNTDQHFALVAYNQSLCTFSVSSSSQVIPASGGTVDVEVSTLSDCSWAASSDVGWASVAPSSRVYGSATVTLSVQPNSGGARSGVLKIAGKDLSLQQQGADCGYTLSSQSINLGASGGTNSFSFTTQPGCNWTATSNASWIAVTSNSNGTGSGTINFSVQANTGSARTGTITIGGQTYTVNQASGCSYSLSSNSANFNSSGGNGSVSVTGGSGCAWSAVSDVSWIAVTSGSSGNGNGTVTFSVDPTTSSRTGTISIAGQTYTISQTGSCTFNFAPPTQNIGDSGGSGSFSFTASSTSCSWYPISNSSWITINNGNIGSGNGTVFFTVAANNTGQTRTGTIIIGGQTYSIIQSGASCTYSLSSSAASSPIGGGTASVNVNAGSGCAWSAQSGVAWITVTAGSTGMGNGTVTYSVSASTGAQRTGAITIAGQTLTITQAGTSALRQSQFDFDGDNKTDLSIFRPSVGEWWYLKSSNVGNSAFQFGSNTDKLVPGDYTGDGKTDIAFFRPSTGQWFVLRSEDSSFFSFPFGTNGDVPAPADFDGDGKTDPAVFRASSATWFVSLSSGGTIIRTFGQTGDIPVVADYDGDNKADIAIYRPSKGEWWLQRSSLGTIAFQFGNSSDKPVQGDYTGDGKTDVAFFRPSSGEWFVLRSENASYYSAPFGSSGDIVSPGDYDGDGKSDFAVFRPSNNTWYIQRSSSGTLIQSFGVSGDKPVPSAFVP